MKPCPFCGGEPHLERNHRNFVKGEPTRVALVRCTQCEAKSGKFDLRVYDPKKARTLAIEAWNLRVDKYDLGDYEDADVAENTNDSTVTPDAAIAKLLEAGNKIGAALRSENPEVKEIAELAMTILDCAGSGNSAWVPVKTRPPEPLEKVWMFSTRYNSMFIGMRGLQNPDHIFVDDGIDLELSDISHWMPKPDPPVERETEGGSD